MASPLIRTKFHMPLPRRGIVARPRLDDILGRASEARLTVVSAPAGFGKTTLLASWLAGPHAGEPAVAWLSLTEGDGDPTTFWPYVVGALQNAVPGIGDATLQLLESGQLPIESVLATVVNELSVLPHDVHLVLDDYHLADGPGIQAGMTFLLEHLPQQAHLVLTTRADPALPLARLRARGELVEIRAADLRFTQDEAATYIKEAVGRDIDPSIIATLEQRTEGWIAALQLAALSIQGRDDVAGFIEGFSGDDRYVVDYLVEEVLQRLPDRVRSFLLRTSVLDRLSAPLCEAVTGERGGRAMLESLDRANLFLVPLDDSRHWYRYHALFADVLHTFLLDEHRDEVPELHRRASEWHDQAGAPVPAVRHALASGDVDRVADLFGLVAWA
jgi:LuxR family maltose regulon positive regulatory protein